jgi:pyrroloquinoline-quinone synthase
MSHTTGLIDELDRMVEARSLLKHPFYLEWTRGTLAPERLRNYAVQYYPHVEAFPRYLSAIHSRCADLATRQALLENLIEEERGAENHPELWLRFAEGLGVAREHVLDATPLAAASELVATFTHLTRDLPIAAGLAALYVYESQIPAVASAKIDGLKRHYDIEDDRTLSFFKVHEQADVWHAQTGARLIEHHTDHDGIAPAVLEAGRDALGALWAMLDSV